MLRIGRVFVNKHTCLSMVKIIIYLRLLQIILQELPNEILYSKLSTKQCYDTLVVNNERPELPNTLPTSLTTIVKKAWDTNMSARPEVDEIIEVLKDVIKIKTMEKILHIDESYV